MALLSGSLTIHERDEQRITLPDGLVRQCSLSKSRLCDAMSAKSRQSGLAELSSELQYGLEALVFGKEFQCVLLLFRVLLWA
jgi:hypothetical protein